MARAAKKPGAAKIRSAAFRRIRSDHQSELAEDYVELIADLIDEKGEARGSDVALRLGVANATVVKTLKRLQDAGLVTQEPYRSIFLTGDGWKMAEDGRRKHKIVESFPAGAGCFGGNGADRFRRHRAPCERGDAQGDGAVSGAEDGVAFVTRNRPSSGLSATFSHLRTGEGTE